MKKYFKFSLIALYFMHVTPAKAENLVSIVKSIECSSFSAKLYSLQQETDFGIYLITQEIKLLGNGNNKFMIIKLSQHYSPNKNLNGRKAVDNEASDWFCLKAATGKHYLWVMFTCTNEKSTSCRYNTESGELYDDTGRTLHLDRMTDAQADALCKRLKIPSAPPNGGFITPAHHILF